MSSALQLLGSLGSIGYFIVLPVLGLMVFGYALQRWLTLDMPTLTRLNFYLVVPAFIFVSVLTTELKSSQIALVVGFTLVVQLIGGLLAWGVMKARGVPASQHPAAVMAQIFFNSGNYGLPLQGFAFREQGLSGPAMSLQVFVIIVQNITSFSIGIVLAALGGRDEHTPRPSARQMLGHVFSLPPIWTVTAALMLRFLATSLPPDTFDAWLVPLQPWWDMLKIAKDGFMVIAMVTLGAQLATVKRGGLRYPVTTSIVLRLVASPALALGLIWGWHGLVGIDPFVAQVLLIASATPTAVNAMLLCLQFDNHPDYLARAVFWSTVVSPITMTAVILLSRTGALPN